MKILVTMGRGGTGKSSFTALMAKYFTGSAQRPILLVDLDPDQNLAEMVGVDLEQEGVKTVADLLAATFIEKGGTTAGIAPSERIESTIWKEGLYEGNDFDLIAVGTKWVEGCYCLPDAALKNALGTITKNYRYVLIDSPAGLEHLNRRVTARVDDIFDIIGPSSKSFAHVQRADRVIREAGITASHFYVVGGYLFPASEKERAVTTLEHTYLGNIACDPLLQKFVLDGRSLLDLPDDSPAVVSVRAILQSAGY